MITLSPSEPYNNGMHPTANSIPLPIPQPPVFAQFTPDKPEPARQDDASLILPAGYRGLYATLRPPTSTGYESFFSVDKMGQFSRALFLVPDIRHPYGFSIVDGLF